jgi:D-glycero-D-manno-heptose 1,7-bisphosphate phosphatase
MSDIKRKAVFFDRDGIIFKAVIRDGKPTPPYSKKEFLEKSGLAPDVCEAIQSVRNAGFFVILVTNQPDIQYGNITKKDWNWIQDKAVSLRFDDIFICFHGRDDGCDCKKPKPGMFLKAALKWNIDLSQSFVIGDTADDVGAAKAAGCKSILIKALYNKKVKADFLADDLITAVKLAVK